MHTGKVVYLAGKITGDKNAVEKFALLTSVLEKHGALVLNPLYIPYGLKQEDYMDICFAMIRASSTCCFISDWSESEGAVAEYHYAKKIRKELLTICNKSQCINILHVDRG